MINKNDKSAAASPTAADANNMSMVVDAGLEPEALKDGAELLQLQQDQKQPSAHDGDDADAKSFNEDTEIKSSRSFYRKLK